MPKVDHILEKNKSFTPKKHTPWDALERFANNLTPKTQKELTTNHVQLENNQTHIVQNGIQNGIQKGIQNGIQKGNKRYTETIQTVYKKVTNGIQNGIQNDETKEAELDLNIIHSISGIKKKILFFIVNLCLDHEDLTTLPINCRELSKAINEKYNSTKQTINRLKKDCLIKSVKNKNGRGGFACFRITELIKIHVLEYQKTYLAPKSIITETVYKRDTKRYTDEHVVSSYINNTTNIPKIFKQIDYSPLRDFGFDESHIIQIYREHTKNPELALSAEIIQNSINALAYDLKHNDVAGSFKHSPTVVLTALLKKGQPYSSKTPHKVLSPREEAMQEYIAAQEKRHHQIQELENKTKEFELQEWLKSLPEQELATFVPQDPCPQGMPDKVYQTLRRKKAQVAAQEYFLTIVWPQKLNQLEALKRNLKPEVDLTAKQTKI